MSTTPNSRSPKPRIFSARTTFVALAAFALLMITAGSAFMAAPLSGAIYTTDDGCGGVNINLFPNKDAVYLNGGPQGGGPGLDEGNYYVKVTEPDGTLLGSSIGGPLGDTPVHVNATWLIRYVLSAFVDRQPVRAAHLPLATTTQPITATSTRFGCARRGIHQLTGARPITSRSPVTALPTESYAPGSQVL